MLDGLRQRLLELKSSKDVSVTKPLMSCIAELELKKRTYFDCAVKLQYWTILYCKITASKSFEAFVEIEDPSSTV